MEFVRVLYASKATNIYPDLKQDLLTILDTAVDFNSRNDITGVLYYGHGYFVQCLEGSKSKVDELFYQKILKDDRHKNCEILFYQNCDFGLFKHWNMKFAPINKRLSDFFLEHHRDDFNPFLLTTDSISSFITLLAAEYATEPYAFELND